MWLGLGGDRSRWESHAKQTGVYKQEEKRRFVQAGARKKATKRVDLFVFITLQEQTNTAPVDAVTPPRWDPNPIGAEPQPPQL